MDYISAGGTIKLENIRHYKEFIDRLNSLKNYSELFDPFEVDESDIQKGDVYEITYHDSDLHYQEITRLVKDMIKLCNRYNCKLNIKVQAIDDGYFMVYLVVKNSKLFDIADKINDFIEMTENKL